MQLDFDPGTAADPARTRAVGGDGRPVPPRRLSPSGAAVFEQCPRRWRFRYIERLPEPTGLKALVGTFAHRVLELLMRQDPSRRTKDTARRLARASWPQMESSGDFTELSLDQDEARSFRWRAWQAIEGLWHLEDPAEVQVDATEEHVSVMLGEVPFRGVVDRLEREPDGLVVSDYKSGRAPSARFSSERLHQVLLYSAAVGEQTGEQPVRAQLLYLGQRVIATPVTSTDLDAAVGRLSSTWNELVDACDTDEFEPKPGPLCAHCAYVENCPEGQAENARRQERRAAEDQHLLRLAG